MANTEGAPAHGQPAHLLPMSYKRMVASWLEEDTPSFDYGGFVVGEEMAEARLLGKNLGIVAGVPFVNEVFHQLSCTIEWHIPEGASIVPVTYCATVRGPVRQILLGERVALNTLARCSGIATKTNSTLSLLRRAGYCNTLAGTRKTTPGFRLVEKYGMLVGGADPHRHDLSAMVMLKDNHIWACSGRAAGSDIAAANRTGEKGASAHHEEGKADTDAEVGKKEDVTIPNTAAALAAAAQGADVTTGPASISTSSTTPTSTSTSASTSKPTPPQSAPNTAAIHSAISATRSAAGFALKIEVECQSEAEAVAAIEGGADVVMLDNFEAGELKTAAGRLKATLHTEYGVGGDDGGEGNVAGRDGEPRRRRRRRDFLIEVSGGLTEENVEAYVCNDVDVISSSSIHQGVKHVDFSLKIVQQGQSAAGGRGGGGGS